MLNSNIDKKGKKQQALKEADDAKKRANTSEKSEHNTEHRNGRTPDNRSKAKQRAGGSPKQLAPILPFPTGDQASGSQDNPEPEHGPKGKQGRPSNKPPKEKEPPVKTDTNTKPKAKAKANPKHDTETVNNDDPEFWKEQNHGLIKYQLGRRNFKKTKSPDGSRMNK